MLIAVLSLVHAQAKGTANPSATGSALVGPVNAAFPLAGEAVRKDLAKDLSVESSWTIRGWVRIERQTDRPRIIAALVDRAGKALFEIGEQGGQIFVLGAGGRTNAADRATIGDWILVSLASDVNGAILRVGNGVAATTGIRLAGKPVALLFAPRASGAASFGGAVAYFGMWEGGGEAGAVFAATKPNDDLILFENGSPSWPMQVKQYTGLTVPQDPATLPTSRSTVQPTLAKNRPQPTAPLTPGAAGRWTVGAWRFAAAPDVAASPVAISTIGFDDRAWLPATVPGTVLTSYVDNGVYPDPAYGLNNMLIPERLNKQDYWFRAEFDLPTGGEGDHRALEFEGVNYASEVWVNGERLGAIEGAFIRGRFTLPERFQAGQRIVLAVKVSPPPHPGIPHEESLTAGPGQNGGAMSIDGPTFTASQGWDWIPSVRDRNTGIWQDVVLATTGPVRLGDPHVRTVLPKPDNSLAELTIEVPVINQGSTASQVTVEARFSDTLLTQTVQLAPGAEQVVRFAPDHFAQLRISNPKLWWPNGYGEPTLHSLALAAQVNGKTSDTRTIRFGIREVSYELSLVDPAEELKRVAISPARSSGEQLLDVRHQHIRKVEGGWAVSLARDVASSSALALAPPSPLAPHLLLKVNGVPIAVRGGNWGMDDWMKRVSRERMEPYFRLHRDANVNTIRNWLGQNTERVFFDLADEYGLLVLNDFWVSSQDHNAEPGDSALLLGNAADTISRYRYHPSIVMWIGRNEGVPPPVLNTNFERLVREIDGTRAYLPNSRQVHMANSGPWNYQQPETYFTKHAQGFSTEVGTPSFPTLETFKAMMPEADQWPVSDTWAYHDWHQGKAGDVANFNRAMAARFGPTADLVTFEKKAQLLNYEAHRAIFEGMNDGLFVRNSGRLLWMTHPAWPSTAWQIYGHDYDTHASYYGTKKGSEPVHVQVNLPDLKVAAVNSLSSPLRRAKIRIRNYSLAGALLSDRTLPISVAAYATATSEVAVPQSVFSTAAVVLTKLELIDAKGALISENLYWLAREAAAYRAMNAMEKARVSIQTASTARPDGSEIRVTLKNESSTPALMTKLSALDAAGNRILPAYWSDNYVSLLPGETRSVTVQMPKAAADPHKLSITGWNVEDSSVAFAK
jgi:hypothetical protein